MSSTAYVQDDDLSQLAESAKRLRHESIRFVGGFGLAFLARIGLAVALRKTREESAHPADWRPSKPEHEWPEDVEAQLVELDRYVQADIVMKRSYLQLGRELTSLFPSFSFFAWALGVPRILDRWFDVRMDSLLGLIALRRARRSPEDAGLTAEELKRRIG